MSVWQYVVLILAGLFLLEKLTNVAVWAWTNRAAVHGKAVSLSWLWPFVLTGLLSYGAAVGTMLVLGHGLPVPPAPGPGPGPVEPLAQALQAAYDQDKDADRAAYPPLLAGLYRTAGTVTANDPALKTLGDFHAVLTKAEQAVLPAGKLTHLRAALGSEFNAHLPADSARPLDAAARAAVGAELVKVGKALEAVK